MRNESKPPILHSFSEDPLIPLNRAHILLCSAAIAAVLRRRLCSLLSSPTPISSSLLLLSDLLLSFMWAVTQSFRWRPIRRSEHPENLALVVPDLLLPNLDVFICTADPSKEPPICVVSATLSVLAFDYPSDKLSVFVSDDACSDLTLFAFMEAARFARHWLPFCKDMRILERCPETFFNCSDDPRADEIKQPANIITQRKFNPARDPCMGCYLGRLGYDGVDSWKKGPTWIIAFTPYSLSTV